MEHDSLARAAPIPIDLSQPLTPEDYTRATALNRADIIVSRLADGETPEAIAIVLGVSPFLLLRFLASPEGSEIFKAFETRQRLVDAMGAHDAAKARARIRPKLIDLTLEAAQAQVDTLSPKTLAETERVLVETGDPTAFKQPLAAPTGAQTTVSVSLFQATQAHAQARKAAPIVIDADPTNGLV
jgi:hypothetical protein